MCQDQQIRFEQRAVFVEKVNYEGDGIWSRFNIMVGIQLALFGAYAYLSAQEFPDRLLLRGICIGGAVLCGWSVYVLCRLWKFHRYWRKRIERIEKDLPDWSKFYRSKVVAGRGKWGWIFPATHPFFYLFAIAWSYLFFA